MAAKKTRFDTFKNLYYCQSRTRSILRLIREFETTFETASRRFSRNHQWYYAIFAQTRKSRERRCITFILSLTPSAYRLSKSKWPAPIFPPLRQRGFRGMDATVHAIFRQFLPTADLSCIEEFLLLGTLWPRLVCSRCSRSRSRPKTVSISIGWNGPLLLLLLLFLVVVLPLFRIFDGSTNGKRREFVAGSLIFPIGLFSSNPKKFQRILLNARICFTTLDKKKQSCNSFSHSSTFLRTFYFDQQLLSHAL